MYKLGEIWLFTKVSSDRNKSLKPNAEGFRFTQSEEKSGCSGSPEAVVTCLQRWCALDKSPNMHVFGLWEVTGVLEGKLTCTEKSCICSEKFRCTIQQSDAAQPAVLTTSFKMHTVWRQLKHANWSFMRFCRSKTSTVFQCPYLPSSGCECMFVHLWWCLHDLQLSQMFQSSHWCHERQIFNLSAFSLNL